MGTTPEHSFFPISGLRWTVLALAMIIASLAEAATLIGQVVRIVNGDTVAQ